MESLEQKKRRLFGKKYLGEYIKELRAITNINVDKSNLLSLVESDNVVYNNNGKIYKTKILFSEKEKLSIFIEDLLKLKDDKLFLSTAYSKDCGLLELSSLKDFNVNFDFYDEHAGLITLVLKDLSNKLLLDFYEENGTIYLEIEAYGDKWYYARILSYP